MNNLPTVTRNLLIINALVFAATYLMSSWDIAGTFGLHFFLASDFHLYQLVTYMFVHGGFTHIFFNMFALWMFGRVMENVWGPRKFLYYYLVCGIGAGLLNMLVPGVHLSVGASGAVYALLLVLVTFLTFFSIHPLVGFGSYLLIIPSIHLCARIIYLWR